MYLLDRTLAIGTGRPVTFLDLTIDIGEPDFEQISQPDGRRTSCAFAYNVRLTRLYGSVAQLVNSSAFWLPALSGTSTVASAMATPTTADRRLGPGNNYGSSHETDWHSLIADPAFSKELSTLGELESEIISLYDSLPADLTWTIDK